MATSERVNFYHILLCMATHMVSPEMRNYLLAIIYCSPNPINSYCNSTNTIIIIAIIANNVPIIAYCIVALAGSARPAARQCVLLAGWLLPGVGGALSFACCMDILLLHTTAKMVTQMILMLF